MAQGGGEMIEIGLPSEELEIEPFVCGAYFEVSATRDDAEVIEEVREQLFAQMMGWA
jgi:hypothetical protein